MNQGPEHNGLGSHNSSPTYRLEQRTVGVVDVAVDQLLDDLRICFQRGVVTAGRQLKHRTRRQSGHTSQVV